MEEKYEKEKKVREESDTRREKGKVREGVIKGERYD